MKEGVKMNTLQPKIGQFRGWHVSTKSWVHGHLTGFNIHDEPLIDISEINKTVYVESDSLGQYTGQFAKISPDLAAAQPWRDVCQETGLTEIVGGYGPGAKNGGDLIHIKRHNEYYTGKNGVAKYIHGLLYVNFNVKMFHNIVGKIPFSSFSDYTELEIIGTVWSHES